MPDTRGGGFTTASSPCRSIRSGEKAPAWLPKPWKRRYRTGRQGPRVRSDSNDMRSVQNDSVGTVSSPLLSRPPSRMSSYVCVRSVPSSWRPCMYSGGPLVRVQMPSSSSQPAPDGCQNSMIVTSNGRRSFATRESPRAPVDKLPPRTGQEPIEPHPPSPTRGQGDQS